jgi:hypothetical protein
MAARSKPHGLRRRVRVEAQHTDGTGAWLEFGHGATHAGKQRNDSRRPAVTQHRCGERATAALAQHGCRERSAAANAEPVLQSAGDQHRHRERAVAPLAQPVLQSAVARFVLLAAGTERFATKRL